MGVKERRERERMLVRGEIIDAAEKIFFTRGIEKTTMDMISAEAEISKATLYKYFKSKDELIYSIFLIGQKLHRELWLTALNAGKSTVETIRDTLFTYVDFYKSHRDYFDISRYVIAKGLHFSVKNEEFKWDQELDKTALKELEELIERGKKEGVIRPNINTQVLGIMSWMQINTALQPSFLIDEMEKELHMNREELIEEYFYLIFNGILNK